MSTANPNCCRIVRFGIMDSLADLHASVSLLPRSIAASYARLEPYGFMVVILLLATGFLGTLMRPLLRLGEYAVRLIVGI